MTDWLSHNRLDRCDQLRGDASWVAAQWQRHDAVVIRIDGDGRISCASAETLEYRPTRGGHDPERQFLLGLVDGRPVFAQGDDAGTVAHPLRAVMDSLSGADLQVAFAAAGLVTWHRMARHCGVCGAVTVVRTAGHARVCPECTREWFPRTDPAVIVAVLDADDRLLLGRQSVWPEGRLSVFAGFVETGESLEQAVHREIAEEVGLEVRRLSYLGSQPWPFPRSLMVGFLARATSTRFTLDSREIESARWFDRAELTEAVESGAVLLPSKTSIAHRMIQAWRQGQWSDRSQSVT